MAFADEIRDPLEEIRGLPGDMKFSARELDTAKLLIDSMATQWDPALYEDEYRKRVEELIADKRKGKVVVTERPATAPTPVVDLMEALQASVEAARGHRPGKRVDIASRRAGGAKGPKADHGAPGDDAEELAGLNKAALQARAAELGVEGRSKMTRQQLVAAITGASKPARRRKAS